MRVDLETKNLRSIRNRGKVKKIAFSMLNRFKILLNTLGLIYLLISADTYASSKDAVYHIKAYCSRAPGDGPARDVNTFRIPSQVGNKIVRHELIRLDCIETTNNGSSNGHTCIYDANTQSVTVEAWAGPHQKAFYFLGWHIGPRSWHGVTATANFKISEDDPVVKELVTIPGSEDIQREAYVKAKKETSKACEEKLKRVKDDYDDEFKKQRDLFGLELDTHKRIIHALCFPGETPVCVPENPAELFNLNESLCYVQVPISSLNLADSVMSWDFETQAPVMGVIKQLHQSTVTRLIKLKISGQILRATEDHPFYLKNESSWVEARKLKRGDELLKITGEALCVENIEEEVGEFQVFNIEVEEYNNYFAQEVLVHNCDELGIPVPPRLMTEEVAAPISTFTNEEKIKASFRLHLGREPSDRELQRYLSEIQKGRSIFEIDLDIAHLSESLVRSIYLRHLKRVPKRDETVFKEWVTFLDAGGNIQFVEKKIVERAKSQIPETNLDGSLHAPPSEWKKLPSSYQE